jgi:hypothetical protein
MGSIDRRRFLGTTAAAGLGMAALGGHPRLLAQAEGRGRVVRARRTDAVDDTDRVDAGVVKAMVDQAVAKLTGKGTAAEAWKALFGPQDVVTVKLNCLFGPGACSHREVTEAVVAGMLTAGVAAQNILVWDRATGDLVKCGYELSDGPGVRYGATDWEPQATQSGSFNGRLAQVLTRPEVTALVNIPVLKTHSIAGITLALKNHYGSFDNPGAHHGNGCDPYLADLNALPPIKDKTRLIIGDALRPVGEGGPAANPAATWSYGGLLAATDPVAVDMIGLEIIDEWRAANGMEPVAPKTRYLGTADKAGLGVAKRGKIELIDV